MIFKRISIARILSEQGKEEHVPHIHREKLLFGASQLGVPAIAFGTTDPTQLGLMETDSKSWSAHTINVSAIYQYRIQDAVVHPPFGIVTIGHWVLDETLAHIPFHWPGYGRTDDEVSLPDVTVDGTLDEALHVIAGNHTNYYHWLLDILPKAQVEPLAPYHFGGTIILPPISAVFHQEILSHLTKPGRSLVLLAGSRAVQVRSLCFIPNLVNHGYAPHPGLAAFYDHLKQVLHIESPPQGRLYVTRKDSQNRILQNESDVIALVKRYGFQEIILSGASLSAQAELFAGASHIIAPHGAGLANVVFCDPGVSVCELHSDGYLNWCFRRLVGVRGGRYGCVVGPAFSGARDWMNNVPWSVPLDQLETALNDPRFDAPATKPPFTTDG